MESPGANSWCHMKRDGEWELKVHFAEGEARMFELVWGDPPRMKAHGLHPNACMEKLAKARP